MDNTALVSAIFSGVAALTALVAVWAGPYLQFRANQRAVISGHRQKWIDDVRNEVSLLISLSAIYGDKLESTDTLQEMLKSKFRLHLLLNPNEQPSGEFLAMLDQFCLDAEKKRIGNPSGQDLASSCTKIVAAAQVILKTEWIRVKKMRDL